MHDDNPLAQSENNSKRQPGYAREIWEFHSNDKWVNHGVDCWLQTNTRPIYGGQLYGTWYGGYRSTATYTRLVPFCACRVSAFSQFPLDYHFGCAAFGQTLLNRVSVHSLVHSRFDIIAHCCAMYLRRVLLIAIVAVFTCSPTHCDHKVLTSVDDIENKTTTFLEHQSPYDDAQPSVKRQKRHLLWPNGISKVFFPYISSILWIF